jgi:hypothetical protein
MDVIPSHLSPGSPKSPFLRRWATRFGLLGAFCLILAGVAPSIVMRTTLKEWVIAKATADLRGTVKIGDASLCWFSEPVLSNVELLDSSGKSIMTIPQVRMSRTLLGLALIHNDIGTVTLEQPTIQIACAGDLTNIEKALAVYIDAASCGPTRTAMRIVIDKGKVTLKDEDSGKAWTAEGVAAEIRVPADRKAPIQLACRGDIADPAQDGKLDMTIAYRTGPGGVGLAPMLDTQAKLETAPLAILATLLHRFEPGLRADGLVSGELKIAWNDQDPDLPVLTVEGHIAGQNLLLADPRLGSEDVALKSFDLPCKLSYSAGKIVAENTKLVCDFGTASLTGAVDLSQDPFAVLQTPGVAAACDLEIAGLARLFSKPMHLQAGTKITGGRLTGSVHSTADNNGVAWSGRLQATGLRGEHQSQPIAWENPVSLDFAAHNAPGALPRIDMFKLVSEFGQLDASGDGQRLTIGGNFDLGLLGKRLGQFVQLGSVQPTGKAAGNFTVQRDRTGAFSVKGNAQLTNLAVSLGGGDVREDALTLQLEGSGRLKDQAYRLESALLRLDAGTEKLDLNLLEPLADLRSSSGAYLQLGVRGDLARWRNLLSPVAAIPPTIHLTGTTEAAARLRFGTKTIEADSAQVSFNNARLVGAGLNIVEPQITIKPGSVKWDRASGMIEAHQALLQCSSLAVQMSSFTADLASEKGLTASGSGGLRGDAARLQRWLPSLTSEQLAGALDGTFRFDLEAGAFKGDAELNVRNLVLGDPKDPTWTEPSLHLAVRGQFDPSAELVSFDEFKLDANAAGCTASGRIAKLSTSRDLALRGELRYDLAKWGPQLRHLLGKDAQLTGNDQRPFHLEGSLAPPAITAPGSAAASPLAGLKGEIGVGWQSAKAHGCQVGPSEIKATMLGDGWVRIHVNDMTFNEGKLQLEPYIRLSQSPVLLAFGKATGIQRARITPEMASAALGYVAPVFWGVRDTDGEMSVTVEPNSYTALSDPNQADIRGKIIIHSAKVTSGPLIQELAILTHNKPDLVLPKETVIPFRVYNGRVYHQDVDLPLGEFTVRSTGSVGFDGTLDLVADLPVPPKWLGKNAPRSMQTIRLPIKGTVSKPKIDENAMKQAMAKYAEKAAENAIKNQFEKAFENFTQPPKK